MLLGVPNFSEGRDPALAERITAQFSAGATRLDSHSDPVHNRTVLTLAESPRALRGALARGSGACAVSIDMRRHEGAHPAIGALDVCPVVYPTAAEHDAARSTALGLAEAIAGEGIPVFLYGELATSEERRERAYFRRGGLPMLSERMAAGELAPDSGPDTPHPTAGATLVTARPPLAAFNVVLGGADFAGAAEIAAQLRESGGGLPGVRAIAIDLGERGIQVSTNVHDPAEVPLAMVIERITQLGAPMGALPTSAEIVGLVPSAALAGFPDDLPVPGFDRERHVIDSRLAALRDR